MGGSTSSPLASLSLCHSHPSRETGSQFWFHSHWSSQPMLGQDRGRHHYLAGGGDGKALSLWVEGWVDEFDQTQCLKPSNFTSKLMGLLIWQCEGDKSSLYLYVWHLYLQHLINLKHAPECKVISSSKQTAGMAAPPFISSLLAVWAWCISWNLSVLWLMIEVVKLLKYFLAAALFSTLVWPWNVEPAYRCDCMGTCSCLTCSYLLATLAALAILQ